MQNRYKHTHKNIDPFLLLLLFFLVLLISLFIYLFNINQDVKNYSIYQSKLQRVTTQDLILEKIFLKSFRFINYDEVNQASQSIEEDLVFFKQSHFKEEFGKKSYNKLLQIEKLYNRKKHLVEQFESPNARATNAIHYLFDLRKTIRKKFRHTEQYYMIPDQIFFQLSKVLMGLPLEQELLNAHLQKLQQYTTEDKYFFYFYQQTKQFLKDVQLIHKQSIQNQNIHLFDAVKTLSIHLANKYKANFYHQKLITMSFFILAFLILIILFFNYRKVKKTALELFAFRYAVENSDNSIVITDADRKIIYVNDAFEESTGYSKEETLGKNSRVLKSSKHNKKFYQDMSQTLKQKERWQGELVSKRKDGSLFYERASIMPIIVDGELIQYLAIKLNVTEYKEQQQKLEQSAVAFETIGDGIIIFDAHKKIVSVNPALLEIFEYKKEDLLGKRPTEINILEQNKLLYKKIWASLMQKDRWRGRVSAKINNGRYIPIWLTITVVRDENGSIENFVGIYTNLEEIIDMKERVNFLAYHDDLTKLPNRIYVEKELSEMLELAQNSNDKLAILFIDLDRFKVINDTLGHNIGDQILIALAGRIKNAIGKSDILARFGGDEFVVITNNIRNTNDVIQLAEKILTVMREVINVSNYKLNTTASIGIACFPEDGKALSSIIKNADSALYDAKEKGKNNYQFYTNQLSIDMQTRLDLEQKLLYALERDELNVVYQPQYRLSDRKICGAEALIRWENPELGKVSPELFISVAEETGVIVKIGYFVFEEASKAYQSWLQEGVELEWIAINISSIQFRQEDLYKQLLASMQRTGIAAENLELEITERCMMDYSEENLKLIQTFRDMGSSISVDDFGTGYSSMSYLKSLPLDKIKIDKSFVDGLPNDRSDNEVSTAIIALSQTLGYEVIAEGIEEKEQEEFLRKYGCDYGQGYYFSKPLSSDELVKFAKNSL